MSSEYELERASVWLSAMIIGATLIELGEMPKLVSSLNAYAAPAWGAKLRTRVVVGATLTISGSPVFLRLFQHAPALDGRYGKRPAVYG